jgi:hypothetical protein
MEARNLLAGQITAIDAARRIWDLALEHRVEDLVELHSFIYAASEWDDRPEEHAAFELGIVEAARNLIDLTL